MIEDIFDNSFADTLKRVFVPCKRIVAEDKCENSNILVGCKILRNFVAADYPECIISENGYIILDFGKEIAGGIRIVTSNRSKAKTRIRFGESVSECCGTPDADHALHDITLTLPGYASLDFGGTGFRFVRIDTFDTPLAVLNIIAAAEMRELPKIGTFISSDERLNTIYDTAVHTIHLNIQDYIYDGIKRDRLIWGGDMHPEVAAILRIFGAIDEIDKSLEQLCFHTVPGKFINTLSSYPLWVLLCIHDLWFYSGRHDILEKYAPFIEKESYNYSSIVNADGSFDMPGEHLFLDWPSDRNKPAVLAGLQGLLALALSAAAKMKNALGKDTEQELSAIAKLKTRVLDSGMHKTSSALQHLAGLADRKNVFEHEPCSGISTFLGYYALLAGKNSTSLETVRNFWGGMIDMGATSFWEDFDLNWCPNATRIDEMPVQGRPDIHADFGDHCYKGLRHSLCHGWAAGPAAWCSEKILGVTPAAPGFSKVKFTPDLCGLKWAKGTVPTPYGEIKVTLAEGKTPEIILPDGISLAE